MPVLRDDEDMVGSFDAVLLNEAHLQDALMLRLGSRRDTRLWRNSVGVYRHLHSEQKIRIGQKGMSDLFGVSRGWFISIEVKSAKGRVTPDQMNWLDMVRFMGGFEHVARLDGDGELEDQTKRAVDECEAALDRFLEKSRQTYAPA